MGILLLANNQFCHEYSQIMFINDCSFLEYHLCDFQNHPWATMNSDLIQQLASQCELAELNMNISFSRHQITVLNKCILGLK
jgi:hypothetical protein